MTASEIRKAFLDFFASKGHQIVPSAPIVLKNDPTLMFTNAGMNQFKDFFLGNKEPKNKRVADTQKCLRVSGKHNDLEEVGVDTYHHTMFEMLGNWSFGDYFKKEAIEWAWELLTEVYKLPKDRIYVTVFEGDDSEKLEKDTEAESFWTSHIAADRILMGNKKDNFWEMGDTGPCGPCSEIHIDLRTEEEREAIDGATLVNMDHPQVVEIWNLVFIQFNRKADKSLEQLPDKHVDTGMGFERLCMAMQGKKSNYETNVFTPLIDKISEITGVKYGITEKQDIALRVIADHIRAISFTIADGQLPSNTGAGYVIRRILRRGVRYAYSVLDYKEPLMYQLLPVLVDQFKDIFPEIEKGADFITQAVLEEEKSFLQTLAAGIKRFDQIKDKDIDGKTAFVLYDTYGFPLDLTMLMARENDIKVDEEGFKVEMQKQKESSQQDAAKETGDWIEVNSGSSKFVGYDELEITTKILKYRKIHVKKKDLYQIVLEKTPFYGESGGQVGDTGLLLIGEEKTPVIDTQKENDLIVLITKKLPSDVSGEVTAQVNRIRRKDTASNHTATHLLHEALRRVLGEHVAQKGSLVHPDYLRFDFSHFAKVEEDKLAEIERMVNEKIRENIPLEEERYMPYDEAMQLGVMALFGEKYGDKVRVITFDKNFSRELCGGTHVQATGEIGLCKITTETSLAAGVRRIVAVTGPKAYDWLTDELNTLNEIRGVFKNPTQVVKNVQGLVTENSELKGELEQMQRKQANVTKDALKGSAVEHNGVQFISGIVETSNADMVKQIAFALQREVPNVVAVLGANIKGKAHLSVMLDKELVASKNLDARQIIKGIAKHIKGGGGGQDFYTTAGGKNPDGLQAALEEAKALI